MRRASLKIVKGKTDVFGLSTGLSLLTWKAVRLAYLKGASEGIAGKVYASIRQGADYNRPGLMLRLLGRQIRRGVMGDPDAVIVAHPLLVAILKGKSGLIYQHGELVAPAESVVRGADHVLVPTKQVADAFLQDGYAANQVIVTGLCIEPALVKQATDCYERRLQRLNGQEPLTGAFFSSGAEPRAHIERLVNSAVHAVVSGGKAILIAQQGGRFVRAATSAFGRLNLPAVLVTSAEFIPAESPAALIVEYAGRRELDIFTARLFDRFDYLVAPSHERTNWALGLGIPMFAVKPTFGPFSPINQEILFRGGVAESLDLAQSATFGVRLKDHRQSGTLRAMAESGWGKHDINGFERAAEFLVNYCS